MSDLVPTFENFFSQNIWGNYNILTKQFQRRATSSS